MSSPSAEDVAAPGRRRAVVGVAVLALLVMVEVLTFVSWLDADSSADEFTEHVYDVTNLANIQRESLNLALSVDRLGTSTTPADVELHQALLDNQLSRFAAGLEDSRLAASAGSLTERFDAIATMIDELEPTDGAAEFRRLRAALDDFELEVKATYDLVEVRYFESARHALRDRSRSQGLLFGTTVVLALFAVGFVWASRRNVRQTQDEAYHALRRSEEHQRTVLNSVRDVIFAIDADGRWTLLSLAWTRLTGFDTEESVGQLALHHIHPDDRASCLEVWEELDATDAEGHREARIRRSDETWVWVEFWVRRTADGGAFGTLVDVTQRRVYEARLHHLALHDVLTGLPNRALVTDQIDGALRRSEAFGTATALLFLDLDRFKLVNDSLGHDLGDQLLQAVAERLGTVLRPTDVAARLGGDEFVVVLEGLPWAEGAALAEAEEVSRRIETVIRRPFELEGQRLSVTASVGITIARPGSRPDDLISEADAAMYRAKDLGKAQHAVYDDRLRHAASQRLRLEHELGQAIDEDQFELVYQPIVDPRRDRIEGVEALLRWHRPGHGVLAPHEFLGVAEEAGMMPAIGRWVLDRACQDLAGFRAAPDVERLVAAVNVGARELATASIVDDVTASLARHGLPPSALCLEVTEHQLIDGRAEATTNLAALRAQGLFVALDDFGTGYSSLSYLRRLPIDSVKIDRSFIQRLGGDPDDDTIVRAIAELASSLELTTVAEGVELPHQLRMLTEIGVTFVQGYLLSRPLDAASLMARLDAGEVSSARGRA